MAIVKASYTRSIGAAKANVRYIIHRPGKDGEQITRPLFGHDGVLTKEQAYDMINNRLNGTFFYRMKFNFDPKKEDWDKSIDLREIIRQAVQKLERKLKAETGLDRKLDFVAAIHDDHSPLRHVHVLALTPGRLYRPHLKELRDAATDEAMSQRKERDRALGIGETRAYDRPRPVAQLPDRRGDVVVGRPGRLELPAAPSCPRCEAQMSLFGNLCICPGCGLRFSREKEHGRAGRGLGKE